VAESLVDQFRKDGPHTVASLARSLPFLPEAAIREALEALTAQGVLARGDGADPEYRYVAPERYVQIHQDVVADPAARFNDRSRARPG